MCALPSTQVASCKRSTTAACSLTVQFYLKKGKKISEDESGWDTFSLLDFNMVKTHREHRGACHQRTAINQRGQPRRILYRLPLATVHFLGPLLNLFSFYTPEMENYSCVTSFQKINIKSSCPNHHDFWFLFYWPFFFSSSHTQREETCF